MGQTTILLADDEPYLTYMVATRLREHGAEVLVASDGEEALRQARDRRPDLVITDYQMPFLTGIQLARRMHELPETSEIPVLLVTARGHRITADDLSATNVRHVIAKPFSTRELVSVAGDLCRLDPRSTGATKAA